jgi:hypothetical protein
MDHFYLGYVLDQQGLTLMKVGKSAEAGLAFREGANALQAVLRLNPRQQHARRSLLETLGRLAEVNLALGDYPGARQAAIELSQAGNDSAAIQLRAAKYLARSVEKLEGDKAVSPPDRSTLASDALGRTLVLLRRALDLDPDLSGRIREDPAFKALLTRPEYRAVTESLVNAGHP